jgi:hypothetical protein
MTTIDDLVSKGYTVDVSFELEDATVYRVEGPGVSTQVRSDDNEVIQSLFDSYDEAVTQQDEISEETMLRWHDDPDNSYKIEDAEQLANLRERVAEYRRNRK